MPRNSSGVYSLHPDSIAVTNDPILASKHNTAQTDIAAAINQAPTRDGKLSFMSPVAGVSAVNPNELVTLSQVQSLISAIAQPVQTRAYAVFNPSVQNNLTATYTKSGSLITVTRANHGYLVGHRVSLINEFIEPVEIVGTVVNANIFSFTTATPASYNASGTLTLRECQILKSSGVTSVMYIDVIGEYWVNIATSAPDINYLCWVDVADGTIDTVIRKGALKGAVAVNSVNIQTANSSGSNSVPNRVQFKIEW